MQLEDLERLNRQKAEREQAEANEVTFIPEPTPIDDLENALALLRRAHIMLGLVSDPELCKVVSKRERGMMEKLNKQINNFVREVEFAMEAEGFEP